MRTLDTIYIYKPRGHLAEAQCSFACPNSQTSWIVKWIGQLRPQCCFTTQAPSLTFVRFYRLLKDKYLNFSIVNIEFLLINCLKKLQLALWIKLIFLCFIQNMCMFFYHWFISRKLNLCTKCSTSISQN